MNFIQGNRIWKSPKDAGVVSLLNRKRKVFGTRTSAMRGGLQIFPYQKSPNFIYES